MVYLVCAVKKPTKKAEETGEVDEIVGKLEVVCADNDSSAIAQYTSETLGDMGKKELRQVEVIVRPFK